MSRCAAVLEAEDKFHSGKVPSDVGELLEFCRLLVGSDDAAQSLTADILMHRERAKSAGV